METIIKVKTCPRCKGKKMVKIDEKTHKCLVCFGSGKIIERKVIIIEPFLETL